MALEKSGCLQLTQEEYQALRNLVEFKAQGLLKASSAMEKVAGLDLGEIKSILDSGEYRIVED